MNQSICDFKNCNKLVNDKRNIMIGRMNPWNRYIKFQSCDACMDHVMLKLNSKLKQLYISRHS